MDPSCYGYWDGNKGECKRCDLADICYTNSHYHKAMATSAGLHEYEEECKVKEREPKIY